MLDEKKLKLRQKDFSCVRLKLTYKHRKLEGSLSKFKKKLQLLVEIDK